MKRMISILLIATLLLASSGCGGGEKTDTVTVKTEGGEQTTTVTMTGGTGEEWCEAGTDWTMQTTGVQGDASATWKIVGLETSGKYAGLCHVIYTSQSPDGKVTMDYWFDETGENGYFEMEVNGQKISQKIGG
jgi:hypothetical protein